MIEIKDIYSKPTIRHFTKNDLKDVLGIEGRSFSNPWSDNMFEALFHINPQGFLVVVIDEKIVGYAILITEGTFTHFSRKKRAHLMNLAVDPNFRKKGIGKALVSEIITLVKEAGIKEIYLEVRTSNTEAIIFYSNFGFETMGTILGFYGDEDALVMSKK